jgi:GNAT superfamily N-acetyltransferase
MPIAYQDDKKPNRDEVLALYRSVGWSSANKPEALHRGLMASHSLVTAWDGEALIGLGNAISDGHLVVYFPHLVVHPRYQGQGIGRQLMTRMMTRYRGFHQQSLLADGQARGFYEKLGFTRAGSTEPMWIFDGHEHD